MAAWKNLDTLASFKELEGVKKVILQKLWQEKTVQSV